LTAWRILYKPVFRGSAFPWHLSIPIDECGQAGNKTNAQHRKRRDEARSERESKGKVVIISADTEALIEKICPHANATAGGRRSGLTQEQESQGHELSESRKERRQERESSDSGGWEKGQGAEVDGGQDRTDKEERVTKDTRDTRTRLSVGFFIPEQAQSGSEACRGRFLKVED